MPRYISTVDRWISHESRQVKAGEEFDTDFPKGPKGEPMRLGDTLQEVKVVKGAKTVKPETDLV